MTFRKMILGAFLSLPLLLASCQKDPDTDLLSEDYMVYTAHDKGFEFASASTFFLPDSILLIGSADEKAKYWNDDDAHTIVARVAQNLTDRGYVRSAEKEEAQLGLQLSYVKRATYFLGWDRPHWWWYYPYYWSPEYWGAWQGWHYPYEVYYGYTAGSLLVEMLNLEADATISPQLAVVWNTFIGGLLTSSNKVNMERLLNAVNQSFEQSPYLDKQMPM